MSTNHNKFKVSFNCSQKQLGDILVALAPYKVSDFDFGLLTEVPYSENSKRASGITAAIMETLGSVTSMPRSNFDEKLALMGFKKSQISAAITRLKVAKRLRVVGDTIMAKR